MSITRMKYVYVAIFTTKYPIYSEDKIENEINNLSLKKKEGAKLLLSNVQSNKKVDIKIGHTISIVQRLASLNAGSSELLQPLLTLPCGSDSVKLEKALHNYFHAHRHYNEDYLSPCGFRETEKFSVPEKKLLNFFKKVSTKTDLQCFLYYAFSKRSNYKKVS